MLSMAGTNSTLFHSTALQVQLKFTDGFSYLIHICNRY